MADAPSGPAGPPLAAPPPEEAKPARKPAGAFRRLAELLALTGFALAQPVLDVTGRSPDFFLYRRTTPSDIRMLLLLVVLAPPLALWLVEVVVGAVSKTAARALHLGFLAGLFGVLLVQVGKHLGLMHGVPLAVLAALLGIGLAVLAARSATFRQVLVVATPAPLVFALLFVLTAPAGALARGGGTTGGVRAAAANRPPVVFVFLDEFPLRALLDDKGQVDKRLFPHFAELAGSSTWYPNATGVSGWTPFAAPAMLSGRYPEHAYAPSYVKYPQNLFTLLGGTYDIKAYETIAQLCPPNLCTGTPAGRPTGLKPILDDTLKVTRQIVSPNRATSNPSEQFVDATVDAARAAGEGQPAQKADFRFAEIKKNQPERFTSFLDGLKPTERPALHFLHLLLPHGPWRYLPDGNTYDSPPFSFVPPLPGEPKRGTLSSDPALSAIGRERLLLQTAYTDTLIGEMVAKLKKTGLYDDALVIVTADHGSGLFPRSRSRRLSANNPAELAWVPLFVKTPHQRAPKVDRRNEQQVDILPTIADVLDVKIPWHVDGQSMLGRARTTTDRTWFDDPGKPQHIDPARWLPTVAKGLAPELARPELGVPGLFASGPLRGVVGRKVSSFAIGSASPARAILAENVRTDLTRVDLRSGKVPAMLWGRVDPPLSGSSTWWAVSVNGTIAGSVAAVPGGDGKWRFLGLFSDKALRNGANDVALYAVDGSTLHPVRWG
ncbi:MAG TPA: sulfatase-like hydrolase/transferase [Mycobacteriales bacterium]|nr:sulfatase-like hydrolase/transferase [Mycobacteriales bacterium]